MKALARFLVAALLVLAHPVAAEEVHGSTDIFSGRGVKLAWAIARGADEARTMVVVRVVAESPIDAVAVMGRDPFSSATKPLERAALAGGRAEIRIPRASFADFPRTDWQFFAGGNKPRVTVFYLGIPDTTPEFADEARLDAYLRQRLEKP